MQRPVNGRRDQVDPGQRKHERNAVRGFGGRARDYAPAVHMVVALMLISLMPLAAGAENKRSYLEMSGGYKIGNFGTSTTSSLYSVVPTLGYIAPRYDVSVSVPFLSLTNENGGVRTTESGLGDIVLRGGLVLFSEGAGGLSLDGALAVKIPTADEMKGLGTGETDYGAFLGLHQRLGGFKVSLNGGYIKIGDPSLVNYNDIYLYGVGISRVFGRTNIAASLDGRRSMVTGVQNPKELSVGFFHILNVDYAIRGSAFKGLNNGGPDYGFNLGIVKWF